MSRRSEQDTGPQITERGERWAFRHRREWSELLGAASDAAWFSPLQWPRSVLGDLGSMRREPYSEYELLWSGDLPRLARYLLDTAVPSVPAKAPRWLPPPLSGLLFHDSHELNDAGLAPGARFASEQWLFINGILTNQDIARMNAAYLVDLFHRPIRVLWNSTDGVEMDLLECATEKLGATGEDVDSAFHPLLDALADPGKKRVVLISHSQGTLITAVLLRLTAGVYAKTMTGRRGRLSKAERQAIGRQAAAEGLTIDPGRLAPVTPDELAKLEVYCFANCASRMRYVDARLQLPVIESYGNEHDLVARLGMLAPRAAKRDIEIDGPRFVHRGAWGHLLNAHYLLQIDRAQRLRKGSGGDPYDALDGTAPAGAVPRLFRYLDGGEALS